MSYDGRVKRLLPILLLSLYYLLFTPTFSYAQQSPDTQERSQSSSEPLKVTLEPSQIYANTPSVTFTFSGQKITPGREYTFAIWKPSEKNISATNYTGFIRKAADSTGTLTFELNLQKKYNSPGGVIYYVNVPGIWNYKVWQGTEKEFAVDKVIKNDGTYTINPRCDKTAGCIALYVQHNIVQERTKFPLFIINPIDEQYSVWWSKQKVLAYYKRFSATSDISAARKAEVGLTKVLADRGLDPDTRVVEVEIAAPPVAIDIGSSLKEEKEILCASQQGTSFNIQNPNGLTCDFGLQMLITTAAPNPDDSRDTFLFSNQPGVPDPSGTPIVNAENPNNPNTGNKIEPTALPPSPPCADGHLSPIYDSPEGTTGRKLLGSNCDKVNTAIGPIDTTPGGIIQNIYNMLLGLSGGIAVIMIIIAGYQLITSQGEPEKIKDAKERITAAIMGLLFIVFSFLIFEILIVNVLKLPGFGQSGKSVQLNDGSKASVHCFGPEAIHYYQLGFCTRQEAMLPCRGAITDSDSTEPTTKANANELYTTCQAAGIIDKNGQMTNVVCYGPGVLESFGNGGGCSRQQATAVCKQAFGMRSTNQKSADIQNPSEVFQNCVDKGLIDGNGNIK